MRIEERDHELLLRIIEHAQRIEAAKSRFGNTLDAFSGDADFKDVVCMNIFQIGELANNISSTMKSELSDIPWDQMYGIRNILAHAYIKIDDSIVWSTVDNDIPRLIQRLKEFE